MVPIVVKKVAYRSVEIFFDEFVNIGEGHLGIYRPPSGSEMILLEEFPDETIFRLFPARVNAFGRGIRRISFPSAFAPRRRLPLPLRIHSGPLGSVGEGAMGVGNGVWWYTGNLEGSRSARRSRRDETSEATYRVWEWYPVVLDGMWLFVQCHAIAIGKRLVRVYK
jgi:hypothetical protein